MMFYNQQGVNHEVFYDENGNVVDYSAWTTWEQQQMLIDNEFDEWWFLQQMAEWGVPAEEWKIYLWSWLENGMLQQQDEQLELDEEQVDVALADKNKKAMKKQSSKKPKKNAFLLEEDEE